MSQTRTRQEQSHYDAGRRDALRSAAESIRTEFIKTITVGRVARAVAMDIADSLENHAGKIT